MLTNPATIAPTASAFNGSVIGPGDSCGPCHAPCHGRAHHARDRDRQPARATRRAAPCAPDRVREDL